MGQALYRKYRSKNLDEVVGQAHVTKTLQKALASGRISHAYLFTGPRGVGKTSVARILAHEVNELPNTGEAAHLDIIEIDAASNRRIDEIRDLRERVHIAPAASKYKVYIIDEVHMLTKEAFNALLKTLEEPPAHVIFVLATTEAHKLPETIISRTQRFSFKPVGKDEIASHLESIAKKEGIVAKPDALEIIAEHSEGSVRDSISLLDQLAASGKPIDEQAVRQTLGIPKNKSLQELVGSIKQGDGARIIKILDELSEQGINPAIAAKELSTRLRRELADGNNSDWLTSLLRRLLDVSASAHPQDDLEISLLEAAGANQTLTKNESAPKQASAKVDSPETVVAKAKVAKGSLFDLTMWPEVLNSIKSVGGSYYSALRLAKPLINDGKIVLAFQFPLHHKKVDQIKHRQQIAEVVEAVCGQAIKIECIIDKKLFGKTLPLEVAKNSQKANENLPLEAISNIFGGAEMLKS